MTGTPHRLEQALADDGGGDLFDYAQLRRWAGFVARAPLRNRGLAVCAFVAVVALAGVALRVLPARYQVQATVLAQRSPVMGSLSNPGLNRDWDVPTRAARELVLRRDNLVSLCKQTDFVNRYLTTRAPIVRARDWVLTMLGRKQRTPDELMEDLVDTLERRLWVEVGAEGTVTITFEWSDRELAYHMVEAALQSFLEVRHASEISIVAETVSILEGHAARVQKEIAEMVPRVEQRERELRASTPRPRPIERPRVVRDEETVRLESVLAARRRTLADLEEFRQRRIVELQAQLTQLQTQYAPGHPALVSQRQNIESLSAASPQIESLRGEIRGLERDITRRGGSTADAGPGATAALPINLADLRPQLPDDDPRAEYERGQLRLLFRQYSSLIDRLDSARVELDTARAAFKHRYSVITPPQLPKRPLRPNVPLVIVAALIGGVAFAVFASAARDLWSGRAVESWQIEARFGIPILAEIRK